MTMLPVDHFDSFPFRWELKHSIAESLLSLPSMVKVSCELGDRRRALLVHLAQEHILCMETSPSWVRVVFTLGVSNLLRSSDFVLSLSFDAELIESRKSFRDCQLIHWIEIARFSQLINNDLEKAFDGSQQTESENWSTRLLLSYSSSFFSSSSSSSSLLVLLSPITCTYSYVTIAALVRRRPLHTNIYTHTYTRARASEQPLNTTNY